jgi:glucose-6-phosphate isomerase
VGFYGFLVNINAYHQPGVEAGKKAAQSIIDLQHQVIDTLRDNFTQSLTAQGVAQHLGQPEAVESIFHVLRHLEANGRVVRESGSGGEGEYQIVMREEQN